MLVRQTELGEHVPNCLTVFPSASCTFLFLLRSLCMRHGQAQVVHTPVENPHLVIGFD